MLLTLVLWRQMATARAHLVGVTITRMWPQLWLYVTADHNDAAQLVEVRVAIV